MDSFEAQMKKEPRCDRCCWWEPTPRGADTMAGRCRWATRNHPVPIWANKVPHTSADQGRSCETFFPGRWEQEADNNDTK